MSELFADVIPANNFPTLAAQVATTPAAGTQETWSVAVPTGLNLPAIPAGYWYRAWVDNEVVMITAGTTTTGAQTWTVLRGQDGTATQAHASGASIQIAETAGALNAMVQGSLDNQVRAFMGV